MSSPPGLVINHSNMQWQDRRHERSYKQEEDTERRAVAVRFFGEVEQDRGEADGPLRRSAPFSPKDGGLGVFVGALPTTIQRPRPRLWKAPDRARVGGRVPGPARTDSRAPRHHARSSTVEVRAYSFAAPDDFDTFVASSSGLAKDRPSMRWHRGRHGRSYRQEFEEQRIDGVRLEVKMRRDLGKVKLRDDFARTRLHLAYWPVGRKARIRELMRVAPPGRSRRTRYLHPRPRGPGPCPFSHTRLEAMKSMQRKETR